MTSMTGEPVVDLMTDVPQRVFPVGRLDYDTTGVLIMTNDGEFANEIIHPRYHIAKVYEVTINGILKTEEIKQLEQGVVLDDGIKTLPAKLWVTNKDFAHEQTMFELTIQEGRNRQTADAGSLWLRGASAASALVGPDHGPRLESW